MSFDINNYYVVDFYFIDDYRCTHPLSDSYIEGDPEPNEQEIRKKEKQLSQLFTSAGWEGDGKINCIFIPPFVAELGGTHCVTIYHVKQSNNGTSWLAIPKGLKLSLPEAFLASATCEPMELAANSQFLQGSSCDQISSIDAKIKNKTSKKQSLEKLEKIIEEFADTKTQMFYRNSFALSCFLVSQGQVKAGKKQLKYLFDVLGWSQRKTYFLDITDSIEKFAIEYASEINANCEINELFNRGV